MGIGGLTLSLRYLRAHAKHTSRSEGMCESASPGSLCRIILRRRYQHHLPYPGNGVGPNASPGAPRDPWDPLAHRVPPSGSLGLPHGLLAPLVRHGNHAHMIFAQPALQIVNQLPRQPNRQLGRQHHQTLTRRFHHP